MLSFFFKLRNTNCTLLLQAVFHGVIDISNDDDSADLVLVGEKVGKSNKGKTVESIHDGFGDHQNMVCE